MLDTCFAGLLGTERGTSYEAEALDTIEQQKCLSHLLKNLSAAEEAKTGQAKAFTSGLKTILREAIKLWRDHREQAFPPEQYRERRRLVRQGLTISCGTAGSETRTISGGWKTSTCSMTTGVFCSFWSARGSNRSKTAPNAEREPMRP